MQYVAEGVLFGLTLSILLGPIFVVLVQASLEKGAFAGMVAGLGVWISDIIIVISSLLFMRRISPYIQSNGFIFWFGLIGGIFLIVTGLITAVRKGNIDFRKSRLNAKNILVLWVRGFLVNTVNPFTFIFWLSVISSLVTGRQLNSLETWLFAGSIMGTIVLTDSLKVFLAKSIRYKINNDKLTILNRVAGVALIIFGFVLMARSLLYG